MTSLKDTQVLAGVREVLHENGFERGETPSEWGTKDRSAFVFEDEYSIVGAVLYSTCDELIHDWPHDQDALSSKISEHFGRGEAKSSDGYLVLMTSGLPEDEQREALTRIRYDTSRLRKLVATGEDLSHKNDIAKLLLPVLPLEIGGSDDVPSSGLDELPSLLDLPEEATRVLIDAYREQAPLLEALHDYTQNR
ncbi:hypothetical protein [Salinibacter grassmerensis]|uniref:hypothetical protein n=1 Tax=Salinibacter grassmerensis TaxID=3040353 RepID=UPI0021E7C63A|nr:hypothetical protein [Salinibacter grassmerensis]